MLTTLALLAHPALAQSTLDCAERDPFTCEAVNEMVPAVNDLADGTPLSDTARHPLRPANIYLALDEVRQATEPFGCTLTGWTGSSYDGPSYTSRWADLGETPQPGEGTVDRELKSTPGTYTDGPDTLTMGEPSRYNRNGRLFGVRGEGFAAGQVLRIRGQRGVVVTVHGTCPAGIYPTILLDDWFGAPGLADLAAVEDRDGDGFGPPVDCDDRDPTVFPGAAEDVRDFRDSDCDGFIDEDTDADGDGWFYFEDCDDADPDVNPGQTALEGVVNGIDDDCDFLVDDDVDQDGDGFTPAEGDCDEQDVTRFPGADETVLNGVDDDCDGRADEDVDDDEDGFTLGDDDCDDADATVNPGAADDLLDCDADDDGWRVFDFLGGSTDCDDTDPSVNPGVELDGPTANGVDDDCRNGIDDDVDADADGFTPSQGDCDDTDITRNPAAEELLGDGIDSDCSGFDDNLRSEYVGFAQFVDAGSAAIGCDADDAIDDLDVCEADWQPKEIVDFSGPLWVMQAEFHPFHGSAIENDAPLSLPVIGRPGSFFSPDPVASLTWSRAVQLANQLNVREGLPACAGDADPLTCDGWRLPTEAEWERAARGGAEPDQPFAGSSSASPVAWFRDNSVETGGSGPDRLAPRGVCQRTLNDFGLCDMSGNVAEWTSGGFYDYEAGLIDPFGPDDTVERVVRGGSYLSPASDVLVAGRQLVPAAVASPTIGFRLVRNLARDIDHDGDGFTLDDGDCAAGDPQRFPGAEEVVDNGLDDDCDGDVDETPDPG